MKRFSQSILFCIGWLGFAHTASAHEAYVLPYDTFWSGLQSPLSLHAFAALKDPANIHLTIIIVLSVWILLAASFIFRLSSMGQRVSDKFESYSAYGVHAVRITIAIAFFFAANSNTFLGPELHGSLFPHPHLIQIGQILISGMIAFGFFTEIAALIGIAMMITSFFVFGPYIFTYLNYFGELVALVLFGLRNYSVDGYVFGPLKRFQNLKKYHVVIVRVFYGVALLYAAITVKLLHPELTLDVVNTWQLTRFHWLFPSDPLLVTFGAGIVEAVIGIFIIFGFEMRLTILISLFYITLSLLFFRELVWPHLLLYGISFNLLVQPETFTLDHFLFKYHRREKAWWKRPFASNPKYSEENK